MSGDTSHHQRAVCANCGTDAYRNMHPQAQVDVWVHKDTRSMHCPTGGTIAIEATA